MSCKKWVNRKINDNILVNSGLKELSLLLIIPDKNIRNDKQMWSQCRALFF
jgi:hypothetical protein